MEWCRKVLKQFHDDDNGCADEEIERQYQNDLLDRLLKKIIDKKGSDEEILDNYLSSLTEDEITILYYKNNMQEFIDRNQYIKDLFINIFESIENLSYAEEDEKDWFNDKVPNEYREDFIGETYDKWNKFVNKQYFMDPNDPPKVIENYLIVLNDFMRKYVYCRYLSVDRVYRLKNFDRKVVTVIDTDSNILSLDTIIDYIIDNIIKDRTFGREFTNNIFIAINTLAYVLTSAVTDILQTYGEYSNVPEEFRPIYSMKNEFLFMRLIIGETKKRYMSKIVLREGNLISPAKYDIKGFDFKKATCSEFAEDFFMSLIKKHIINSEKIEVKEMLQGINEFKIQIKESIQRGERTYLPNASAKEMNAYKNPESEQSVRGVLAWNYLFPENRIDVPTKVSLLKLNIFKEEDIEDLKTTEPEYYNIIIDKIFNDTTGIFVTSKWEFDTIDYVNVNNKEWYNNIPKKYRSKYKKLGPDAWNEFVDKHNESNPFDDSDEGHYETKKRGMQVIAIPSNATIPSWLNPYIDYSTMINTILSPFVPVLEIFKEKTVEEGKTINGVNRKTAAITNIIKF